MKKLFGMLSLTVVVAGLAACDGTTGAVDAPTGATPETTAPTARSFSDVEELKDAVVAAGYECPNWNKSNHVVKAATSGSCSDADVLSVYSSESDKQFIVERMKASPMGAHFLTGENWIVNAPIDSVKMLSTSLGGVVVEVAPE